MLEQFASKMNIYISLKYVFCLTILWPGCYSDIRIGLWAANGSSGLSRNKNEKKCILNYMDMKYGVIRVQADGGGLCENLPYTWLLNPTYAAGYKYMLKEHGKVIMRPPMALEPSPDVDSRYKSYLPRRFDVSSSITIRFSPKGDLHRIVIDLFDESETITVMHMNFREDFRTVVFNHFANGRFHTSEENNAFPFSRNNLVELTMLAGRHFIDTKVNGTLFHRFNVTNRQPTTAVRKIRIGAVDGYRGTLYSLEFNTK